MPVEQLPPRVASACDNGPIGLRRNIIERQRWNSAQHGVEPRPTKRRVRRFPIDTALQLHACDNRHEYSALECSHLLRDRGSPSRKWIATLVSSRNVTVRGLCVREALRRRAPRWRAALATPPNVQSSRGWRSRRGKQSAHLRTERRRVQGPSRRRPPWAAGWPTALLVTP